MTGILEAKDLSKWYGHIIAVNNISFSIGAGIVGLLGPNGAGKSTLMKLITGLLRPNQGEIKLFGEQVWNRYELYNHIGFSPEQDAFYERMTGAEFLTVLLKMHGFSQSEAIRKTDDALARVNLTSAANKVIGAYSKGMRQRIKLAQAMAHDPDVLILDEPLAGMDPVARHEAIRLVRKWGREGKCVVVSSHILYEIEAMTSNILLLHNGQVLAEGDIHQIRALIDRHPHNIYLRCSHPRKMAEVLVGFSDVVSVRLQPEEKNITVESRQPDKFYERLPQLLIENEIELEEITSPDDNLQAVFNYLVK